MLTLRFNPNVGWAILDGNIDNVIVTNQITGTVIGTSAALSIETSFKIYF